MPPPSSYNCLSLLQRKFGLHVYNPLHLPRNLSVLLQILFICFLVLRLRKPNRICPSHSIFALLQLLVHEHIPLILLLTYGQPPIVQKNLGVEELRFSL